MGPEKRPKGSKVWQGMVRSVFDKLVANLKGSEAYRAFFGSRGPSPDPVAFPVPLWTPNHIEVETAHLRRDVTMEDEAQEGSTEVRGAGGGRRSFDAAHITAELAAKVAWARGEATF